MKENYLGMLAKIAIVLAALCGFYVCMIWYPIDVSLSSIGLTGLSGVQTELVLWSQLIFHWGTSIPCFIVLFLGWRISDAIGNNAVFTAATAKKFRKAATILFIDLAVFVVGNLIYFAIGINPLVFLYLLVAAAGLAIAIILAVAAHFVGRAAALQEETEGTL